MTREELKPLRAKLLRSIRTGGQTAALALAGWAYDGCTAAREILLETARGAGKERARIAALGGLGLLGGSCTEALETVLGCLSPDESPDVLVEALRSTMKMKRGVGSRRDSFLDALELLSGHPDDQVRHWVRGAARDIGGEQHPLARRTESRGGCYWLGLASFDDPRYLETTIVIGLRGGPEG